MSQASEWADRRAETLAAFRTAERARPPQVSIYIEGLGWLKWAVDDYGALAIARERTDGESPSCTVSPSDARKLIDWYTRTFGEPTEPAR